MVINEVLVVRDHMKWGNGESVVSLPVSLSVYNYLYNVSVCVCIYYIAGMFTLNGCG